MNLSDLYMRLPDSLRRRARKYLARTPMHYELPSGVFIEVGDRCDWAIYNDVFVCGEYDEAIDSALDTLAPGAPLRVVDLGANVGYFLLRALDRARRRDPGAKIEGLALEGAPSTFEKLVSRVGKQRGLTGVSLVNNLTGQRTGHGFIDDGESSAAALVGSSAQSGQRVEYLDLETALTDWRSVHIVKCDIEGSEEALVRSYPTLLAQIHSLVIEIHPMYCDSPFVKHAIEAAGLHLRTEVVGPHGGQNCFFTRQKP